MLGLGLPCLLFRKVAAIQQCGTLGMVGELYNTDNVPSECRERSWRTI